MTSLAVFLATSLLSASAAAPMPEASPVTYTTPDGVRIVADYYLPKTQAGQQAPVVILLHQYPSTR